MPKGAMSKDFAVMGIRKGEEKVTVIRRDLPATQAATFADAARELVEPGSWVAIFTGRVALLNEDGTYGAPLRKGGEAPKGKK